MDTTLSESAYIFPLDLQYGPNYQSPYMSDSGAVYALAEGVEKQAPGPGFKQGSENFRWWRLHRALNDIILDSSLDAKLLWTSDRRVSALYANKSISIGQYGEHWALAFPSKADAMRFKLAMPDRFLNTKLYQVLNESRSRE